MEWLRTTFHKVLQITHGRTTFFFMLFFVAGHVMAAMRLLTPVYVGYMTALGTLVLGHSIKDDIAESKIGPRPPGGPDAFVRRSDDPGKG